MKIGVLLFVTWLSLIALNSDESNFQNLDSKTVLSRLFDNPTFNSKQEALWQPNYSERINMPVSDDGFCHTVLDTALYYTSGNEKQAVLIFATYQYQTGVRTSCHVCSPLLSIATFRQEDNKGWSIEQFKKEFIGMGAWGDRLGRLGIEKLGDDFYCLKVQSAVDGNQGYERGITSYYSLNSYDRLNEVFSFVYYDSNEGAMEDGKGYTEETSLKVMPEEDSYFGIELSSKRTDRKLIVKKKYKYSEEEERYISQ